MEYAEEHEKSEKDFKAGHSAGKGRGREENRMARNLKSIQLPAGDDFSSAE